MRREREGREGEIFQQRDSARMRKGERRREMGNKSHMALDVMCAHERSNGVFVRGLS